MFQGIFKSAINDANKNYIFGTGSIPIQIKNAQLATFADGTTKQQGYQVAEVNKLISTMLTGWDANGNKPKSMSDNYLELILSCDNGFVVKKRLQFPHIIAWQNDSTPYNIADVYKEFSIDNWLKADDFENPDITLVVEPTDEILTTSTATPPEVTTTNSGRFYLYYRNLPVGINRVHIDFHIKTKTEPIDFDLEVIDGLSLKDAQVILASNDQAKINVLLSSVKDVYNFTGAEGSFEEITMFEWSALYQQIISLNPSNKFTHDLLFVLYESEINTKVAKLEYQINGFNIDKYIDIEYSDDFKQIDAHRQNKYINFKNFNVGDNVSSLLISTGGTLENAAFARCAIKKGNNYRVFGRGDEYASLVITDDSANIITKITSGNYTISPYEFTAESDGYLFVQNRYFDGWDTCKAMYEKFVVYKGLVEDVEELKSFGNYVLKGKNIVLFGDSMSSFVGIDGKTYANHVEEKTGAIITNVAIGGTRLAVRNPNYAQPTSTVRSWACLDIANLVNAACTQDFSYIDQAVAFLKEIGYDYTNVISRLKSIEWENVDIVIIEGGTNDWLSSQDKGSKEDDTFLTSFGAVNYMIKVLLTTYPHIKLYFESNQVIYGNPASFDESQSYNIGNVVKYNSKNYKFINAHQGVWNENDVVLANGVDWRLPEYWSDNQKIGGYTAKELIDAYEELVISHHIPYINMYKTLGWNEYNFSQFFKDSDNHHPYKGFEWWADKLINYLLSE